MWKKEKKQETQEVSPEKEEGRDLYEWAQALVCSVLQKKMGEREQSGRPLHKCTVCGRTDKDFPDLEFRYCSKCDGAYEYCSEHLYTHKHIVAHSYDKQ